ncbi:hypothetical protein Kisp02_07890 [Kineosporia sp. NBRC 101731]|nr:hypothetical protein Kisp02_07890 [Kineosporia sp. NBRC 101731]
MKVLGLKCGRDKIAWAVLEGETRLNAVRVDHGVVEAPKTADRGETLVWVRREVHEMLERWSPDRVSMRLAESVGKGNVVPRAETEGVVTEAVTSRGIVCDRLYGASVRAKFSAKTAAALTVALEQVPCIVQTPSTRRDPVIVAAAVLPKEDS